MGPANALDVLIYHNNYSDTYTNIKGQMEADGHTVTGSTSTTVASNLINSYDVVIDLLYNNNCGSTCRGNYDDFVEAGGVLIISGENESNFSSRNANIESLISNKFGGSLTMGTDVTGTANSFNSTYTDNTNTYTFAYGSSLSGDGEWVVKVGTSVVWMTWQGDDLPSGYTGAVYVTADINQFQTSYGGSAMKAVYSDLVAYGSSSTPTYSSAPTTQQLNLRTSTRGITHSGNGIYIQQSGDNLDLDVQQHGDDNLVAGTSTTSQTISDAVVSGDYNTVNITQGSVTNSSDDNVLLFGINGNHNSMTVSQGDASGDTGGHRAIIDITGGYNTIGLTQYNLGFGTGQFADINVNGNDNTVSSAQRETDKMLFVDINGSDNSLTTNQKDSGQHFLDITLGSDQTVSVTQEGTGDHAATIDLSGYSSTLQLNQNSSTDQTYSIDQNCLNANGCGTTTVNQY